MAEEQKIELTQAEIDEFLTCKPLRTYDEILQFLESPPLWRSLCKGITRHSDSKIKNLDLVNKRHEIQIEEPETFCHISPDAEDPKRYTGQQLPKTLVCHDMANGYHDDSLMDGSTRYDEYTFYNWAGIDIFCYFSHHLITIPPLGWINVAHAHGVKVIGTVITEWAKGLEFWEKVLASEIEYQNFASALVAIACTLKFDGWLLNVENKITKPDYLLKFVRYLNELLHLEIPHAELIWYDSVTVQGHLNWQNGLNDKNRAFFDACDGIFTNYSWNEFDLTTSAIEADTRLRDLYVGIDVWGRNFYSGGEFNTQEALKLVHQLGCSFAIFAPAWTHEALSDDQFDSNYVANSQGLTKWERFILRDRALWGSFWPFLNTHLPCTMPFKTSFCKGQGKRRWHYGEVVGPGPWYNLRHQQYQPNSAHGPHGYVLSLHDAILQHAHVLPKEHTGIIHYRESFTACLDKAGLPSIQTGNETKPTETNHREHAKEIVKSTLRHRIMNAIRKYFKIKHPKSSQENLQTVNVAADFNPILINDDLISNASKPDVSIPEKSKTEKPKADEVRFSQSESTEPEPGTSVELTPESADFVRSSGKSMLSMSVNLKLGQGRKATWPRLGLAHVPEERECLEVWLQDAYSGGSCLRVNPPAPHAPPTRVRLFHCDFQCTDSLIVCVVTKTEPEFVDQYLDVQLHMRSELGHAIDVVLAGAQGLQGARDVQGARGPERCGRGRTGGVQAVSPVEPSDPRFKDLQTYLLVHEPNFYVPVENDFGWSVRYYQVHFPGNRVTMISVSPGLNQGPVLLGHFGICHMTQRLKNTATDTRSLGSRSPKCVQRAKLQGSHSADS